MKASNKDMSSIAERFAGIVGSKHVLTDEHDMAAYLDEPRAKFKGRAAFVVRPKTTHEVSDIMTLASETRTAIVPQGGNTGLVGGQVPDMSATQVILSLARLNEIRDVRPAENALIADAGATLQAVHDAAEMVDREFPLSLASQGTCTIGGNLSTNAGGVNVVAYGNARDLVLGLEVVLADGRIWDGLNTLRKNNTGVDLKHLFIASEGTLGIITAAALKLVARVHERSTALVAVPNPKEAIDLLNLAQAASSQQVTSIELMPEIGLDLVTRHQGLSTPFEAAHPWYVLLEMSAATQVMENLLADCHERGIVADAVIAHSDQQRQQLWQLRELLPESQKPEGGSIKHDVSLPISRLPEFLAEAEAAVKEVMPDARPVPFGHVGDGNIHFNITQPVGADKQAFLDRWVEVNEIVHAIVLKFGGSISAEHGIGVLKRDLMPSIKSPVELDMMKVLKQQFDPLGILNPGKLLPNGE